MSKRWLLEKAIAWECNYSLPNQSEELRSIQIEAACHFYARAARFKNQ